MLDLFVGGAAGPPGRPGWVNNAFPDSVKNDPVYNLAAALVELSSLFFQDNVLRITCKDYNQGYCEPRAED